MHLKLNNLLIALFATLAAGEIATTQLTTDQTAATQVTTSLSGPQGEAYYSAEASIFMSLNTKSEYQSLLRVLNTGVPQSTLAAILDNPVPGLLSIISSQPGWFTSLPSDAQSVVLSIASEVQRVKSTFYEGLTASTQSSESTLPIATPTLFGTIFGSTPLSTNGAPAATGMMGVAGVAGAIGVAGAFL